MSRRRAPRREAATPPLVRAARTRPAPVAGATSAASGATAAPTAAASAALALARALGEPAPTCDAPLASPVTPAAIEAASAHADVCTVEDVARWLGVNRKTVYDAVHRRELPCARLGRRVLFSRAAISAWLGGRAS